MSDKLEILKMIESGKITVDEGLQMIEALEQTEKIEDDVREEIYSSSDEESINIEKEIYGTSNTSPRNLKNFDVSLTTCKLNVERSNVEDVTIELLDDKTREYINKPEWLHMVEDKNTISIKESRVTNLTDIFDFFKSSNLSLNSIFINVKIPMEAVIDKGKFTNVSGSISLIGLKGVDIEARSVSGKVYAADIKSKIIQLKSTSGSVIADNLKAAKGYLKTTSGKVKFSGETYQLECKSVSGSTDVECGQMLEKIVASTVSGKVTMYLLEPESFNLQLSTVSGGIETNGFAVVDKSNSGKRSVNINNRSESKWINASTISGKIVLDKL
ncbi:DUF4097 family beta strand repeat-containing protein [Fusibacter bizertensis]